MLSVWRLLPFMVERVEPVDEEEDEEEEDVVELDEVAVL